MGVYAVYNQDGLGWSIWLKCLSQKCNSHHLGHRGFELDQHLLTEGQSPRHQSAYEPIKLSVLIGGLKKNCRHTNQRLQSDSVSVSVSLLKTRHVADSQFLVPYGSTYRRIIELRELKYTPC